ncbi:DegV family protein [Salinibius halmophilus]|uniref:DegV family protein n=1 Tax=Salinibius halmophilus TaxID=1853216 RepID=UPI000E66A955|nr:DegV family protein [Salinibius halmophilus]
MSVVLVVDSACDLPAQLIEQSNIKVLPINIKVNGELYKDKKSDSHLLDFYNKGLLTNDNDADSVPYTTEEIEQFILSDLVSHHDFVFVQTVASGNSPIFDNASKASQSILKKYQTVRQQAGRTGMFGIRVIDTTSVFTGQGLIALYTSEALKAGAKRQDLRKLADDFKATVSTYAVPKSVGYVRERARRKGVSGVSALGAMMGKALDINPIILLQNNANQVAAKVRGRQNAIDQLLDYATDQVVQGNLTFPYVNVSYAGELDELRAMAAFQTLEEACKTANVTLLSCVMNLTGGLNLGPEAVCLSLVTEGEPLA